MPVEVERVPSDDFYHLFLPVFLGRPLNTCSKHVFWDPPTCFLWLWFGCRCKFMNLRVCRGVSS